VRVTDLAKKLRLGRWSGRSPIRRAGPSRCQLFAASQYATCFDAIVTLTRPAMILIARVLFLGPAPHGRSTPVKSGYRALVAIGERSPQSAELSVVGADSAAPGETHEVEFRFVDNVEAVAGGAIELREGLRVIGEGRILRTLP
jgi:hypothetical protein